MRAHACAAALQAGVDGGAGKCAPRRKHSSANPHNRPGARPAATPSIGHGQAALVDRRGGRLQLMGAQRRARYSTASIW
jgi:hypothetical protein